MNSPQTADIIPQVKDLRVLQLLEDLDPFNCPVKTLNQLIGHEVQEPAAVLFLAGLALARARFDGALRYYLDQSAQAPHAEALFDLQGFIAQFEALPGMSATDGAAGLRACLRNIRLTLEAQGLG